MTLLGTLAKLASIAGAVERAGSAISSAVRSLRRMPRPAPLEPSMPLTHQDAEIQAKASRGPFKPSGRYD